MSRTEYADGQAHRVCSFSMTDRRHPLRSVISVAALRNFGSTEEYQTVIQKRGKLGTFSQIGGNHHGTREEISNNHRERNPVRMA